MESPVISHKKPRMLAADVPEGLKALCNIFAPQMEITCASSIEDAVRQLADIDVIVCGLHFDDSRMFDFLRIVKASPLTRAIPFVCYRDLDSELAPTMLESLQIAIKALGGTAYVDVYIFKKVYGVDQADNQFRQVVMRQLETDRITARAVAS